jgi:tetratricopeptide (TPR) repeat protein/ADP-heptose:LPS heptosyltransferase
VIPEAVDSVLKQAEDCLKAGDRARAEALAREALARDPGSFEGLLLLGVLHLEGERPHEAIPLLERALAAEPQSLRALDALSAALMAAGDPARAEGLVRRALALDASLVAAHMRLGMALAAQGKWREAAPVLERALERDPRLADAHHNLGEALAKQGRVPEAIACFQRALALEPSNPDTHNALGFALQELGLWEAAERRYQQALALAPDSTNVRYNLGLLHLFHHDFERGWAGYEERLRSSIEDARAGKTRESMPRSPESLALYERLPRWRGPQEPGVREVAIWSEQGIGDQVLFSTLIPELVATGIPVVYEVDRRLRAAYERAFPQVRFVASADPPHPALQGASRVLLAGSLPGLLRRAREDFARQPLKLLAALPERVTHYRARLGGDSVLRVALSWKSTREDWWVRRKNASLAEWAPLFEVPGVRFADVQYGDTAAERAALEAVTGVRLARFDEVDYMDDLEEVLAILEASDLVITTSNATAHFAGALGKRTWLLYLSDRPPFFYWAHRGDYRSLWYPAVELVSGPRLADWPALARFVAQKLREEIAGRAPRGDPSAARRAPARPSGAVQNARRLRAEGRLEEAVDLLRRAIARAPGDAAALAELAHALRWQDRLEEARTAAAQAVAADPGHAEGWFNLGAVEIAQGDPSSAIASYRRALALEPGFAEAWSNLGEALGATGDKAGEIAAYRRAVAIDARLAPVWSNLGVALLETGEVEAAIAACRLAVEIAPAFAAAWNNLGTALRERGEHAEAARAFERAVEQAPRFAEAWSNLGGARLELGALEEAMAAHRRALELAPRDARVHYNLGIAHERCRQYEAALARYREAVALDPGFAAAHLRLACVLLMRGEFASGWALYEWRWREKNARPKRYDFTAWTGSRTAGRRLLLWGEQGIGDEIIYASMIGELVQAGLRITLETDPRLVSLMRRSFPGVEVVVRENPPALDPAAFDWQCPLASLGRWLRPSFGSFPRHAGYLVADPQRVVQFSERLRQAPREKVVGLSWISANREIGPDKSIALADWAKVLGMPGVRFVDLQYGDTAREREALEKGHGLKILHLDELDLFNDLEALAALCAACDLVVTVSNVTAHMAGALGRPVWLLAPGAQGRIWYWFCERSDSPWYPSMRIFTQPAPGRWQETLEAVARELAAFKGS